MLPRAIAAALQLPKLEAADFTATKFDMAEVKSKFGNHLLRFIAEDFPASLWNAAFYRRLSHTFGNIAHYNSAGFWNSCFETSNDQIEFLETIARFPCWGSAAFTYSDVERVIRARVANSGVIAWKPKILSDERKKQDLAELARLKSLYEPEITASESQHRDAASAITHMAMTQTDFFS
jgi:hypothetical protein